MELDLSIPDVARPVSIVDLEPEQQEQFYDLLNAFTTLTDSGVDQFQLFATMPIF